MHRFKIFMHKYFKLILGTEPYCFKFYIKSSLINPMRMFEIPLVLHGITIY